MDGTLNAFPNRIAAARKVAWHFYDLYPEDRCSVLRSFQNTVGGQGPSLVEMALTSFLISVFNPVGCSSRGDDGKKDRSEHPLHSRFKAICRDSEADPWDRATALLALGEIERNPNYLCVDPFWPWNPKAEFDSSPATTELVRMARSAPGESRVAALAALRASVILVPSRALPQVVDLCVELLQSVTASLQEWKLVANILDRIGPRAVQAEGALRDRLNAGCGGLEEDLSLALNCLRRGSGLRVHCDSASGAEVAA